MMDGGSIAHDAGSGAVSAVGGTVVGDREQDSVGVAMHQAGNRAGVVFRQRIHSLARAGDRFPEVAIIVLRIASSGFVRHH